MIAALKNTTLGLSDAQKGIILAAAGFSLFSFGDVFLKYLGGFYNPFTIAFLISGTILVILIVFNKAMGGFKNTFKTPKWKLHMLRGAIFAAEFILVIYGLSHISLALGYALLFLAPFIAPILAIPILKIKPRKEQWLAILLGFIGVLIILRPGTEPLSLPSIGLIIAAAGFAMVNVLVRKIDDGKQTLLSWVFYVEAITCAATALIYALNPEEIALAHFGIVIIIAVFFIGGLTMVSKAFSLTEPATAAPFQYIQILWGTAFGYCVFGDIPTIWTALGASLIIGTGIWLVRHQRRPVIKDAL